MRRFAAICASAAQFNASYDARFFPFLRSQNIGLSALRVLKIALLKIQLSSMIKCRRSIELMSETLRMHEKKYSRSNRDLKLNLHQLEMIINKYNDWTQILRP